MSKYVIELRPDCKVVQQICEKDGQIYVGSTGVHYLGELTVDYIKKNCKSLLDAFYQKGLDDGKAVNDKGCKGCEYEEVIGDKCRFCANRYPNQWTEKQDDKIEVRDEVVWTEDENVVIVVTSVYTADNMEWCDGVCKDGKVYSILAKNARKTGRRFDISKILEDMSHD